MDILFEMILEVFFYGILYLFDRTLFYEKMNSRKELLAVQIVLYSLWLGLTAMVTSIAGYFTVHFFTDFSWVLGLIALISIGFTLFMILRSIRYTKQLFFRS